MFSACIVFLLFGLPAYCSIFDSSYLGNSFSLSSEDSLSELEGEYTRLLAQKKHPLGLYFVGAYENDFNNGEDRYWYGIEWRFFDEGYFEFKKMYSRSMLEARLQFLQLKRDHFYRKLSLLRQHIHFVENYVLWRKYKAKQQLLEQILKRRSELLSLGLVTQQELEDIKQELILIQKALSQISQFPMERLSEDEIHFLNRVENLKLRPFKLLFEEATSNSLDLTIQDVFKERANFLPSWKDNLDVKVYALQREEFYGPNRWMVGVRCSVPLFIDKTRSKLVSLQSEIYEREKSFISKKLERELRLRLARFEHQRLSLVEDLIRLSSLEKELSSIEKEIHRYAGYADYEPYRKKELLEQKILDLKFDILQDRLKVYLSIVDVLSYYGALDYKSLFVQ